MSVHYKFKSNIDHDTVTFDGLNISVADLKKSIMQQKKIGKSSDFDLQITNAQTKEVYDNDDLLIPKNTSVIVARIPVQGGNKKNWDKPDLPLPIGDDDLGRIRYDRIAKSADLVNANTSEEDKVKAMITQSSVEYDPSKYMKSRNMTGPLPPTYTCFRCGKTGHWIKNCPTNNPDVKRSTGIPRSFMVPVDGPEHKGALLTSSGDYAVPLIDHQAYKEVKKEKPPFVPQAEPVREPEAPIPEELLCMFCKDLLQDAVLIPCCGNSFCDECVRQVLLESENHECPVCNESGVSPDTLIPNRFLRTAVLNFKNETGYTRVKKAAYVKPSPVTERSVSPQPSPDSTFESQTHSETTQQSSQEDSSEKRQNLEDIDALSIKVEEVVVPKIEEKDEDKEDSLEIKKEIEEDIIDNQPGTPLADEPIDDDDVAKENQTIQIIGQEQYSSHRRNYEFSAHSKYNQSHQEGSKRSYREDSPGPKPISTIETITNLRNKNKFLNRPAPVRQQFSQRDDRSDSYPLEDDYRNHYDKRHVDRNSQRNHHSHYNRPRNDRYHQTGNMRHYQEDNHHHDPHYNAPMHGTEPVRKHPDRYRSSPQTVVIAPPPVYVPPVVAVAPPVLLPPPQVFPPQPPPPGASPIDTSHLTAQPPPPGVGPLLPTPLTGDTNLPYSGRYDTEDPLKFNKKENERSIDDKLEAFQRQLEKRDRASRSRSRSSGRHRSRSRSYSSKSWSHSPSRSLSRTPRSRSRTPFSSRSRSRSLSYSRSRSRSKIRSFTRSRSRARTESRSRSRSRIRRRGHSRERVRSPRHRTKSRSFSPRDFRGPPHRNIPSYPGKPSYPPLSYQGTYTAPYAPPSNILAIQAMRPPAYPPHHMHPIAPVPTVHSRSIDHYPADRPPKYSSYNDNPQYSYDSYSQKYQHQRYDREQRGYEKTARYDRRQEYQRQEEEAPHRIPGWIGDRSRDYKPRNRSFRDSRKEIKELPKVQEREIKELREEILEDPMPEREERKSSKSSKEREEKTVVKHKKHHHHHKNKENKKYDSKSSNADSVIEKDSDSSSAKLEKLPEEKPDMSEVLDSDAKSNKSVEKPKEKKHKHKKHKASDQTVKKKKTVKKEKNDGAPSTDSDLPLKAKIKKKKTKLKQPPIDNSAVEPETEKVVDDIVLAPTDSLEANDLPVNDSVKVDEKIVEEPEAGSVFISEELNEEEPVEIEINVSREEIDEPDNIDESNNTEEEEIEDEDVLRVDVPALSKWERDSGAEEADEEIVRPQRRDSVVANKEESLPTEIIQKAEQVFLSHQMKPRIENKEESGDSKSSSSASSRESSPEKPKDNFELKSVVKTERVPATELRVVVSKEKRSVHSRREDSDSRDSSQFSRYKQEGRGHSSRHREDDRKPTKSHSSKSEDKSRETRARVLDRKDRRYSPKRESDRVRNSSRDAREHSRRPNIDYNDEEVARKEERRRRFAEQESRHSRNVESSRTNERRTYADPSLESRSARGRDIIIRSSDSTQRTIKYKRSRSRSFESLDSLSSHRKRSTEAVTKREHRRERSGKEHSEMRETSHRRKHSPIKAPEQVASSSKSSRSYDFNDVKFEPNYDEFSDEDEEEEKMIESKEKHKRKSSSPDSSRKRMKVERADIKITRKVEKSSVTSSASSSAVSASESSDSEDEKITKSKKSDSDYKSKHKKSRHKKHKKHKHKHKKKKSHKSKRE